MGKIVRNFEKFFTYLQIFTGILILLFAISKIYSIDISLFIELNLSLLLAVTFLVSGILLLKNNKIGYILSVISWFGLFCHWFITIIKIGMDYSNYDILQTFIIVLPFLLFSLFFLNNLTRKKYKVVKADFYVIVILAFLLIIDSLYVNEFLM